MESSDYLLKRQRKGFLEQARRIAIVGLRAEPIFKSYGRTQKLIAYGLSILPVLPDCESFLGVPCYKSLASIGGEVDIVQVYPDPALDLVSLALEAIQKGAKVFWIEDHEASESVRRILAEAKVNLVEFDSLECEYRKHYLPSPDTSLKARPSSRVSERMTRNPVTVKAKESMSDAVTKMKQGHFRHLPVVDDTERLIGMLSDRDLRLVYPASRWGSHEQIIEQLATITVERAAVFNPVAVLYDASLEEAANLMLRWQVGALPVVSGDSHLVGIITYADMLEEFLARSNRKSW
jgi:CBS domain-containing protein/predicted CoA-binding protein